ncbi:MAG: sigma-70 family RNA polymerase sigma factor [Planctomycetia bacterium]|nr:sigma-70 family RNA polymerase sigma factor [Planctomycetia bacterium]
MMQDDTTRSDGATNDAQTRFVGLLTAEHDHLLGYVLSLVGRRHDAEDVLQKASLVMWQKFHTFDPERDFLAWATTICFYEARNFVRLAARSPHCFDDTLLAIIAAERVEHMRRQPARFAALEECLEELTAKDRDLLRAVYIDGEQIAALARALERAPQTVYNRLNALRRLLAECVSRRLAAS